MDYFYQLGVPASASKRLRFRFVLLDGKSLYFEFMVLVMGLSGSPFCSQMSNRTLMEAYTLKYGVYGDVYLDDSWTNFVEGVPHFDQFCKPFNVYFKDSKKEVGSVITLLGIELNLIEKTARLNPAKARVIKWEAESLLNQPLVAPTDLHSFLGRIEFASRVTTLGRVNTTGLITAFNRYQAEKGDIGDPEPCIDLGALARKELLFWKDIKVLCLEEWLFRSRPLGRSSDQFFDYLTLPFSFLYLIDPS